jgi:hypothetical protein
MARSYGMLVLLVTLLSGCLGTIGDGSDVPTECEVAADCDDGDDCTDDSCFAGVCSNAPVPHCGEAQLFPWEVEDRRREDPWPLIVPHGSPDPPEPPKRDVPGLPKSPIHIPPRPGPDPSPIR